MLLFWINKRRQRTKRVWTHRIFERRHEFGEYHHLLGEILSDAEKCISYIRMLPETFETGRISQMWRILLRQLDSLPTAATDIVKAITVLHNFVIDNEPHRRVVATQDFQHVPTHESLRNERRQRQKRQRSTKSALNVRESFMRYFNSDAGSVPWQNEKCFNM